jgi:hypothetical protein
LDEERKWLRMVIELKEMKVVPGLKGVKYMKINRKDTLG